MRLTKDMKNELTVLALKQSKTVIAGTILVDEFHTALHKLITESDWHKQLTVFHTNAKLLSNKLHIGNLSTLTTSGSFSVANLSVLEIDGQGICKFRPQHYFTIGLRGTSAPFTSNHSLNFYKLYQFIGYHSGPLSVSRLLLPETFEMPKELQTEFFTIVNTFYDGMSALGGAFEDAEAMIKPIIEGATTLGKLKELYPPIISIIPASMAPKPKQEVMVPTTAITKEFNFK